jgi:flagellar motor component MotA
MAIGGAGVAAFLISNSMTVIKAWARRRHGQGVRRSEMEGVRLPRPAVLLFLLTKTMKSKGVIALESHIEKPHESTIFQRYPKVTEGPLRRRLHLRHPADDDHEPRGSLTRSRTRWKSSSRSTTTRR